MNAGQFLYVKNLKNNLFTHVLSVLHTHTGADEPYKEVRYF
jgi:hypothetical protein